MATKFTSNFLNPFEKLYYDTKNNPLFTEQDWDNLVSNYSQQDLENYSTLLKEANDKGLSDVLLKDDLFSSHDTEWKTLKLQNELGYTDNTELKQYDIVTGYKENGDEITEKQELTEKQYYDYLLNIQTERLKEQRQIKERNDFKANLSNWDIWWNSVGATLGELGVGAIETIENVSNLLDAYNEWQRQLLKVMPDGKNNWREASKSFREKLTDGTIDLGLGIKVKEWSKELHESLVEWERDNTYYTNDDGNYTSVGKIFGSTAYSVGQQIPTWFVGPAGQIGFYSSIFESKMQESFENTPSISTSKIIFEAAAESAAEYAIELGLGKLFGATGSDLLRGVSGTGKISTGISRV